MTRTCFKCRAESLNNTPTVPLMKTNNLLTMKSETLVSNHLYLYNFYESESDHIHFIFLTY